MIYEHLRVGQVSNWADATREKMIEANGGDLQLVRHWKHLEVVNGGESCAAEGPRWELI